MKLTATRETLAIALATRVAVSFIMAIYTITGQATFSKSVDQNNARSRMDTALLGYVYSDATTSLGVGITYPSNTTINVSIQVDTEDDDLVRNLRRAIYDSWVGGTRQTSGWLSSNKVT